MKHPLFRRTACFIYHGISPENLAIVGKGYSSPERVGLMAPLRIAFQKARSFSVVAACSGIVLSLVTSLTLNPGWNIVVVVLATGLLSGICAAIFGGLFGFLGEGSTASIYRHHLNHGRYLLLIEGPEKLVYWGQDVLSHYSASSLY